MFCNEIVEKAYCGQPKYQSEGNVCLDCYFDMALYITKGYREILETEHYYISIQHDGVVLLDKMGPISTIEGPNEWIDSHLHLDDDDPEDTPWTDYEWTLFVGEKLESVTKVGNNYSLKFSDFELELVPQDVDNYWFVRPYEYCKVIGTERLIKPCICGGKGILDLDLVFDYGVRCERCHRGTCANPCACDAIDEWNTSEDLPIIGDYPEELFEKHCDEQIDYIAIHEHYKWNGKSCLECESIMVSIGGRIFNIGCRFAGYEKYDFEFGECTDYNHSVWPRWIRSTAEEPIRFERREYNHNTATLRFLIGNRQLLVTANCERLLVGISHKDNNGRHVEFSNNQLFNDGL